MGEFRTSPKSPEIKGSSVLKVSPKNGGQVVLVAALGLLLPPSQNPVQHFRGAP